MTDPCNIDAERTILGAIFVEPVVLASVAANLQPEDFYDDRNAQVYRAMIRCMDTSRPIDLVTIKHELAGCVDPNVSSWAVFLSSLLDGVPRIMNVDHWSGMVRSKAIQRRVVQAARQVVTAAAEAGDGAEAIEIGIKAIMGAGDRTTVTTWGDPAEDLMDGLNLLERIYMGDETVGVKTGLCDLDRMIGGFKAGELILVGARPSIGKTAFAITVGENIAAKGGKVGMLSLEMTRQQIATRRLCAIANVSIQRVRAKEPDALEKTTRAYGTLEKRQFYVDDTFVATASQVRAKVMQLIQQRGQVDLVIVDYLGLMQGGGNAENRVQEVAELSRALKLLAKDLSVPVMALSQLNRKSEHRDDKVPQLSDLRDSGALEQDADVVLLLHRKTLDSPDAKVIIAKQRNGPTGQVDMHFNTGLTIFQSAISDWEEGAGALSMDERPRR